MHKIVAGVVCALVGFTSSFTVVLAGLTAVGATPAQAASGLLALTVLQGLGCMAAAWRYRTPVTIAWSTPGAALLVSAGGAAGGFSGAVGAFIGCGALIVLTGLWQGLADLIAKIPAAIAQAMLAGVLLPLVVAPVTALAKTPWIIAPIIVVWLVLARLAPLWAVPGAFVTAAIVIVTTLIVDGPGVNGSTVDVNSLLPQLEWTNPTFTVAAFIGITIPLYIVTMASQNIPGVAVMKSFGYDVPWRFGMVYTGVGTMAGALFGGHAINLAAISAALAASDDVDPDKSKRWVAAFSAGCTHLVLAAVSAGFATLVVVAPDGVMQAVAGLALLGALAGAIAGAVADAAERPSAVLTFVIASAPIAAFGIGSAFWALMAGMVIRQVLKPTPANQTPANQTLKPQTPTTAAPEG